jgi:hypothetical protein
MVFFSSIPRLVQDRVCACRYLSLLFVFSQTRKLTPGPLYDESTEHLGNYLGDEVTIPTEKWMLRFYKVYIFDPMVAEKVRRANEEKNGFTCGCGSNIRPSSKKSHLGTNKHLTWQAQNAAAEEKLD